jgi:hypothetical protein
VAVTVRNTTRMIPDHGVRPSPRYLSPGGREVLPES